MVRLQYSIFFFVPHGFFAVPYCKKIPQCFKFTEPKYCKIYRSLKYTVFLLFSCGCTCLLSYVTSLAAKKCLKTFRVNKKFVHTSLETWFFANFVQLISEVGENSFTFCKLKILDFKKHNDFLFCGKKLKISIPYRKPYCIPHTAVSIPHHHWKYRIRSFSIGLIDEV